MSTILLNGSDWTLTGWMRHQWYYEKSMETNAMSIPTVAPVPAIIPGSVQTDLLRNGIIDDWNIGSNFRKIEWIEHREWVYAKHFTIKESAERYVLHFDGLDFRGFVFLNQHRVLSFEGMHIPYRIDVTDAVLIGEENELRVVFLQPPEVDGQIGYTSKTNIFKSRFNYGWDWSPRLVNIGIFRDVYLETVNGAETLSANFRTDLSEIGGTVLCEGVLEAVKASASVSLRLSLLQNGNVVTFSEKSLHVSGKTAFFLKTVPIPVDAWFPNGFGNQPLYIAQLELICNGKVVSERKETVGFRTISYAAPEGAPKGCLPYTPVINGKKIPIRGINWVPLSPFYGSVTKEDYRFILTRFCKMNCNLIRVWGGALRESQEFYRLCDEMGFLVWQEFPQSSSGIDNAPNEDPDYINGLEQIAVTYIHELRSHVSLTYWCGGNELYWNSADKLIPVDHTSANIAMLENTVKTYCPEILFLPSSPSRIEGGDIRKGDFINGDCHGEWLYGGLTRHYSMIEKSASVLFSEVGTPACPRKETLEHYCDTEVWPPDFSNDYWVSRGAWWISYDLLQQYFGSFEEYSDPLAAYVAAFRYLQAESLRYSADAVRRHGGQKSGIIFWMGNESFPNAANNSLIEYDGTPKPAFYEVQKSFAPISAELSYQTVAPKAGELFGMDLVMSADKPIDLHDLQVMLFDCDGICLFEKVYSCKIKDVCKIDTITVKMPENLCTVRVESAVGGIFREWSFFASGENPMRPLIFAKAKLHVTRKGDQSLLVENIGNTVAYYNEVFAWDHKGHSLLVTPNYFCLRPGENKMCHAENAAEGFTVLPMNQYNEPEGAIDKAIKELRKIDE